MVMHSNEVDLKASLKSLEDAQKMIANTLPSIEKQVNNYLLKEATTEEEKAAQKTVKKSWMELKEKMRNGINKH